MQKGRVKFYDKAKGFGFIIPEEGDKDIFVHATGLSDGVKIKDDDEVTFDTEEGNRGINAVNVELA